MSPDVLIPVSEFFPGRSARWIADTCRAGKIPGAIKVGHQWRIRPRDFDAFVRGAAPPANVDAALERLRSHGV